MSRSFLSTLDCPAERLPESDADLLARFTGEGDEAAFTALLRRHSALVRGVCRRLLACPHDADDAFQATFLILARKAGSLDRRPLAGWLYGVAYHVALRARARAGRRKQHEALAHSVSPVDPVRELTLREGQAILDEELARLPEKYRAVLVLCCLEGLTRDEAARRLDWRGGLVKSRLEEARGLLRRRLAQRGVDVPAVLALPALTQPVGVSAPTPEAMALAEEALRTLPAVKVPSWLAALVTLGVLAVASVALAFFPAPPQPPAPAVRGHSSTHLDVHGDPLPPGAVVRLGTVRFRHGHWIYALSFSPDGRRIASGSVDTTVRIWDRATGKEHQRLSCNGEAVLFAAFTPDGRHLISASGSRSTPKDTSIRLWDLTTGKEIRRFLKEKFSRATGALPMGTTLSTDGKLLAAGHGQSVFLVEVATGRRVGACHGPEGGRLRSARFSPDGKKLAAVFEFAGVCLFDVETQKLLWVNKDQAPNVLANQEEIAFSPDGKTLAVAIAVQMPMRLLDVSTGKERQRFTDKTHAAAPVLFLDDGKKIFTNSWGGHCIIWDVATGKQVGTWNLPRPLTGTLSPDGKVLATAEDRAVQLWDAHTGKALPTPAGARAGISSMAVSPDSKTLVASSAFDQGVRVWDLATGRLRAVLSGQSRARTVALAPDGKTFVVGSYRGTPAVADATTAKVKRKCEGTPQLVDSVVCAADGRWIVGTGWTDTKLRIWDAQTGKELPPLGTFPKGSGAKCLALSPNGKQVATGGMDGVVRLWDVAARKEVRQLTGQQGSVWGLAYSPDGRWIAAVTASRSTLFQARGEDRSVRIWDVTTGKEVQKLTGPPNGSWCVAWSPDGRLLATGGEDNLVRVWELASGQERMQLVGHQGAVMALNFAHDGRLISGSSDSTALVWNLTAIGRPASPPRPQDFPSLWDQLRQEASRASRAITAFVAGRDQSVAWLAKQLRPVAEPDAKKVARFIAALDSDEFKARDRAEQELRSLGEVIVPALDKALEGKPSLEVRRRLERLLKQARTLGPEQLRVLRAVEALERIATTDARRLLDRIAAGAASARVTIEARAALQRLKKGE